MYDVVFTIIINMVYWQACRGEKYDDGVNVAVKPDAVDDFVDKAAAEEDDEEEETDARGLVLPHKKFVISPAPIFKDFLVMYATTPGKWFCLFVSLFFLGMGGGVLGLVEI